jgi:hypothetical protein
VARQQGRLRQKKSFTSFAKSAARQSPTVRASLPVFPTPVGMVRSRCTAAGLRRGFPHARGDGPLWETAQGRITWFSPPRGDGPMGVERVENESQLQGLWRKVLID